MSPINKSTTLHKAIKACKAQTLLLIGQKDYRAKKVILNRSMRLRVYVSVSVGMRKRERRDVGPQWTDF